MNLQMNSALSTSFNSNSQKARVITEQWVSNNMFCPRCGCASISHFENNRPVADFFCQSCGCQYELKSKNGNTLNKINDGAYDTMIERIMSNDNPDFMFMSYNSSDWTVRNFFFVPKHFFTPLIIEKRKALSSTARRAGWVGCNILLGNIPTTGRIPIVENGVIIGKEKIIRRVNTAESLYTDDISARGWLMDVLNCVDKIGHTSFTLDEMYRFEPYLSGLHPDNHNIKAKIRQQLQVLRDRGIIEFTSRGNYRRIY